MPEVSLGPVGAITVPNSEPSSDSGKLTTLTATPMIRFTRRMTPNAVQKRPRISRHERTIAARIPARSSTRIDGTSSNFVLSHTHSGIIASTSRMPITTVSPTPSAEPPTPAMTPTAMMPPITARSTSAASDCRTLQPTRRQNAGRIWRHSLPSDGFSPRAAWPTFAATTPCMIAVNARLTRLIASTTSALIAIAPHITGKKSGELGESDSIRRNVANTTAPTTTAVTTATTS